MSARATEKPKLPSPVEESSSPERESMGPYSGATGPPPRSSTSPSGPIVCRSTRPAGTAMPQAVLSQYGIPTTRSGKPSPS